MKTNGECCTVIQTKDNGICYSDYFNYDNIIYF